VVGDSQLRVQRPGFLAGHGGRGREGGGPGQ
jgi:hypothetical protein